MAILTTGVLECGISKPWWPARAALALCRLPGLLESRQQKSAAQAFFALPREEPFSLLPTPKEAGTHQSQLSCSPNRLLEI